MKRQWLVEADECSQRWQNHSNWEEMHLHYKN